MEQPEAMMQCMARLRIRGDSTPSVMKRLMVISSRIRSIWPRCMGAAPVWISVLVRQRSLAHPLVCLEGQAWGGEDKAKGMPVAKAGLDSAFPEVSAGTSVLPHLLRKAETRRSIRHIPVASIPRTIIPCVHPLASASPVDRESILPRTIIFAGMRPGGHRYRNLTVRMLGFRTRKVLDPVLDVVSVFPGTTVRTF